jgi:hypothetical protein
VHEPITYDLSSITHSSFEVVTDERHPHPSNIIQSTSLSSAEKPVLLSLYLFQQANPIVPCIAIARTPRSNLAPICSWRLQKPRKNSPHFTCARLPGVGRSLEGFKAEEALAIGSDEGRVRAALAPSLHTRTGAKNVHRFGHQTRPSHCGERYPWRRCRCWISRFSPHRFFVEMTEFGGS